MGQEGNRFQDHASFSIDDGFSVIVSQVSYVWTFVHTMSEDVEKFKIESLIKDEGLVFWKNPKVTIEFPFNLIDN